MRFRKLDSFETDFDELPAPIQTLAKEKFRVTVQDPNYPSLRVKKMQGHSSIWEAHINIQYVFTFEWDKDLQTGERIIVLRRIGTHQVYKNP